TSSHYKNSPNDLQLMADAPAQRLFVLLPRSGSTGGGIPDPLAVLQVSLEGHISRSSVLNALARGTRGEAGDLIPWTLSQQFQDPEFASALSGARIVRVAVRAECARMGYGRRAVGALREFYAGAWEKDGGGGKGSTTKGSSGSREAFVSLSGAKDGAKDEDQLHSESIAIRSGSSLPALLHRLSTLPNPPEKLDWLGVSYGMTPSLLRFWNRAGYVPLYVRQMPNEITGEYSAVQVRSVLDPPTKEAGSGSSSSSWLGAFAIDFQRRFLSLLGFRFREWDAVTALTVLENISLYSSSSPTTPLSQPELRVHLTPFDMKRLEGYGNGNVDFAIVLDLVPVLASLYFSRKLYALDESALLAGSTSTAEMRSTPLKLSALQSALLIGLGAQRKDVGELVGELDLPAAQVLALFVKGVRRIMLCLRDVERRVVEGDLGSGGGTKRVLDSAKDGGVALALMPGAEAGEVEGELERVGQASLESDEVRRTKAAASRRLLDEMDLGRYAIDEDDVEETEGTEVGGKKRDWSAAEAQVAALAEAGADGRKLSSVVSVQVVGGAAAAEEKEKSKGKKDSAAGKRKGGAG
ncbi:hypothetical protein A4X09_0g7756, partial [Tilletia walkeri]